MKIKDMKDYYLYIEIDVEILAILLFFTYSLYKFVKKTLKPLVSYQSYSVLTHRLKYITIYCMLIGNYGPA